MIRVTIPDTKQAWEQFFNKNPEFKDRQLKELHELLTLMLVDRLAINLHSQYEKNNKIFRPNMGGVDKKT